METIGARTAAGIFIVGIEREAGHGIERVDLHLAVEIGPFIPKKACGISPISKVLRSRAPLPAVPTIACSKLFWKKMA